MGIIILSGFLFAGVFILIVAKWIVDYSFTEYDNSTISGLYANSITNTTIALVTVAYVLLTGIIVTQSRKEQQIRDIENRLEKFYIPAEEIINNSSINKNHKDTINGLQTANYDGLKHLKKYSYLANKTTFEAYEKNNIRSI